MNAAVAASDTSGDSISPAASSLPTWEHAETTQPQTESETETPLTVPEDESKQDDADPIQEWRRLVDEIGLYAPGIPGPKYFPSPSDPRYNKAEVNGAETKEVSRGGRRKKSRSKQQQREAKKEAMRQNWRITNEQKDI